MNITITIKFSIYKPPSPEKKITPVTQRLLKLKRCGRNFIYKSIMSKNKSPANHWIGDAIHGSLDYIAVTKRVCYRRYQNPNTEVCSFLCISNNLGWGSIHHRVFIPAFSHCHRTFPFSIFIYYISSLFKENMEILT